MFFQLATTGLDLLQDEILQIAANGYYHDDPFFCFVKPTIPIHRKASALNHMSVRFWRGPTQVFHNGVPVRSAHGRTALTNFFRWLRYHYGTHLTLVSHNAFGFMAPMLCNAAMRMRVDIPYNLIDGFADTLPAFRAFHHDLLVRKDFDSLAQHFVGQERDYFAPNDVELLKAIVHEGANSHLNDVDDFLDGFYCESDEFF